MHISDFEWDMRNKVHLWEHGVETLEAEEVFINRPVCQRAGNDTYVAFGVSEEGRHLLVVFSVNGKGLIRVITAREMTEKEKRNYRKRK